MSPQEYAAWRETIQAARTRASLHTLEHRVREFVPDAEVLQLRQLCGQRRRAPVPAPRVTRAAYANCLEYLLR